MVEEKGEGEDELIAGIGGRGKTDWMGQDTVRVREQGEWKRAEGLTGNYRRRYRRKVYQRSGGGVWRSRNAIIGNLMDDFRTWQPSVFLVEW